MATCILYDQSTVKCLNFYVYCVFINIRRSLWFFLRKCLHLDHTTVPTLSIEDTEIDQKWSKITKKSSKKTRVQPLSEFFCIPKFDQVILATLCWRITNQNIYFFVNFYFCEQNENWFFFGNRNVWCTK